MEIKKIENNFEISFHNNDKLKYTGIYIIFLFMLVSLIFSKISIQTVIMNLIFFTIMNIANYVVLKNINSIEVIILKKSYLIMKRLRKNKKVIYEKKVFYDEIFSIYYQENFINFYKRDFNFDIKRSLKIKTYFNLYSFGYKMSYEDFLKIDNIIKEKIKAYKEDYKKNSEKRELEEKYVEIYNLNTTERYLTILNIILEEEKIFILEDKEKYILNIDKNMAKGSKEIDFYIFYVNYLSKKEYENKKVLVGYNGIDGKEVSMLKLKEDINEIRDGRSTLKGK